LYYRDLPSFLKDLERQGELRRIRVEVDPELEITEIVSRVIKEEGPALLFENVKGSPYPLAINVFGSPRRIELALFLNLRADRALEHVVHSLDQIVEPERRAGQLLGARESEQLVGQLCC
jgi:4-hydroxy-3-polyprenylbenzoate decarboxylase